MWLVLGGWHSGSDLVYPWILNDQGSRAGRQHAAAASQLLLAPDAEEDTAAGSSDSGAVKRRHGAWRGKEEVRARQIQNEAQRRYRCAAKGSVLAVREAGNFEAVYHCQGRCMPICQVYLEVVHVKPSKPSGRGNIAIDHAQLVLSLSPHVDTAWEKGAQWLPFYRRERRKQQFEELQREVAKLAQQDVGTRDERAVLARHNAELQVSLPSGRARNSLSCLLLSDLA